MTIAGSSPLTINRRLIFSGIFLISMSGLVLEVAITRIFSAAMWYHYAFAAVSVALLGLGASGLAVQYGLKRIKGNWAENLAIVSALAIVVFVPITLYVMHGLSSQTTYLPLYMFLFTIPFFLIGIIISAAFNAFAAVAGRLYAADMIGASAGALIVVLFLILTGGEGAALIVGVIAAVTATIFARITRNTRKTIVGLAFVGFASFLFLVNYYTQIFAIPTDPTAHKDLPLHLREYPGSKIVKTQWNSFSRIDVVEGKEGHEGLEAKIFIDGGAGTDILAWDGNVQSRQDLTTWTQYQPYQLMKDPKVLVIGSGGGRDVVAALVSGSKDVTSVEINPIIFDTVKSYGNKAGNVYTHEYVQAHVDEGRSFITRTPEKYDIIYIPFVDTWASVSSGGLGVSENFLYTLEGFEQYYEHMTDRGKIVTLRWLIDTPRFVSTYVKLLEQHGVPLDKVHEHLIIVTADSYELDPSVTMVIFSKGPFTDEEIDFLSSAFARHGSKPILIPGQVMREPYSQLLTGKIGLEQFQGLFQTKAYHVTDDSPYFLSYEKPFPVSMQNLLIDSVIIVIAFLFLPFLWVWRRKRSNGTEALQIGITRIIPYFAALGMGFILIELSLLQKLTLLLGNPTTTFVILLFTVLVSSGCGSLFSSRIIKAGTRNLGFVIAGIVVIGMVYYASLPPIIYSVIALSFEAKAWISVAILAPIGFLLGMPLPTGMRLLRIHRPELIPSMWAVNGAFSVLGAVISVILGIMYGSSVAMLLGISVYLVAIGVAVVWRKLSVAVVVQK